LLFGILGFFINLPPIYAGELYAPKTELSTGDTLEAEVRFNTDETADLYIAVALDGVLWFYSPEGFSPTVQPFLRGQTLRGSYPIFKFAADEVPSGQYTVYQLTTLVDSNPLDSSNWYGDLHSVQFNVDSHSGQNDSDDDDDDNDDNDDDDDDGDDHDNDGDGDDDDDDDHDNDGDNDNDGDDDNGVPNTTDPNVPSSVVDGFYTLLAFNDLGMHCMDEDYSVFSILPPYNVINAQVLKQGREPELLSDAEVEIRYSPIPDPAGSINSYSVGKTNFWQYANQLFNTELPEGQGLSGKYMPADSSETPTFDYEIAQQWFQAAGIPMTAIDDAGNTNPYPMLRISAHDKQTGTFLTSTDVVVPVAQETDCKNCHATGAVATVKEGITWSNETNLEVQAKWNIVFLHDAEHATQLAQQTPVLCASCHYSAALDLAGEGKKGLQKNLPSMSQVMHQHHGKLQQNGQSIFPTGGKTQQDCYQCHPGTQTQCQRGAMSEAAQCQDCHGDMLAVGGEYPLLAGGSLDGQNDNAARRPWVDTPRCQSCHTGDAVNHLNADNMKLHPAGIRLIQTYLEGDASASPIKAENQRFAENENTLFRNSKGHGGVACEGCHGSTHAIWENPDEDANDNVTATQLQGHSGTIIECQTCHDNTLPITTNGPHGMHNVNDPRWIDHQHERMYERDEEGCKACHGMDLLGTVLSKMPVDRALNVEGRTVRFNKGDLVGCNHCHSLPH
ncbi:hypothetical protein, partial [Candidatus Albibeggiatoa sp. nov. BB20]|uniref:hypothetical protein n=1 Tax=Candidatus Albibeggiatoa sp. nov. BB20 TaxID=3162723 RepID=UPI003365A838